MSPQKSSSFEEGETLDEHNMLWMHPEWEEHKGATKELEDTTDLLFKTYR
jgi:hypothetical protein